VVAGVVGAGVVVARRGQAPAEATTAAPAPAPLPSVDVRPSSSAAPVAAQPSAEAAALAPSAGITLDVTTDPAGATITKNGFQVCDETPCQVLAALNETLELEAEKGALRAKARVLAQRDQKVSMKLVGQARPRTRLCEVEVDGLKILRPCQ
jgi:hypothetical protein